MVGVPGDDNDRYAETIFGYPGYRVVVWVLSGAHNVDYGYCFFSFE